MQTSAEHPANLFYFFPFIFIYSHPPFSPLSQQLGEEAINGRGGREKMNKDGCIQGQPGGQNEGFSGEECGRAKADCGIQQVEWRPVPARIRPA